MDTVTQGLLGAVTAQLGFRQRIGRDASWVAFVAAIVPDLDIFVDPILSLTGSETDGGGHMLHHRGLSHSLLAVPVLAAPVALAWWAARRRARRQTAPPPPRLDAVGHPEVARKALDRPPPRPAPSFLLLYACVLIAVLTHPLLDWCTTYGTQLFAPLTDRRYAIDAVPILDIFYTPILILTLAACWLARKLSSGEARGITLRIGWAGFLLSVGYLAAGRVLHDRAIAKALAVHPVRNVVRADAYPSVGTILLWRVVIETPDDWRAVRVHQFGEPSSYRMSVARRAANAWIDRARTLPVARTFDWFAMGRTRAQYSRLDDTHVVELQDMRYGLRPDSMEGLWAVRVIFSGRGDVLEADFLRRHRGHRFRELLRAAWSDIWNP